MTTDAFNELAKRSLKDGDIDITKLMLEKGADNYEEIYNNTTDKKLKKYIEQKFPNICYNKYMLTNDVEIVKLMIEKGANNFNECLLYAVNCYDTNIEIVKLMLEKGANNYNKCLEELLRHMIGHQNHERRLNWFLVNYDIIKLLIEKSSEIIDYNKYALECVDYKDILEFFIEKGANRFNDFLEKTRDLNIVKLLIKKGANNYNDCMYTALKLNDKDMLIYIIDLCNEKAINKNISIHDYLKFNNLIVCEVREYESFFNYVMNNRHYNSNFSVSYSPEQNWFYFDKYGNSKDLKTSIRMVEDTYNVLKPYLHKNQTIIFKKFY